MKGRRTFALDPSEQPTLDRLDAREDLMTRFREATSTEERARVARSLRALDCERLDAGTTGQHCDCSSPDCAACETRLDGAEPETRDERRQRLGSAFDGVLAARWLGREKLAELEAEDASPGVRAGRQRRVMVATIAAAKPHLAGWAEASSLDAVRGVFDELDDPPPELERKDSRESEENSNIMSHAKISPIILAKAQRIVRDASRWRADATDVPLDQLEALIRLSKVEGISLQELIDALGELNQLAIPPANSGPKLDARESTPDGARAARDRRNADRWRSNARDNTVTLLPGGGMTRGSRPPGGEAA